MKKNKKMMVILTLAASFSPIISSITTSPIYAATNVRYETVGLKSKTVSFAIDGSSGGRVRISYYVHSNGDKTIISANLVSAPNYWEYCYADLEYDNTQLTLHFKLTGSSLYDSVTIYSDFL